MSTVSKDEAAQLLEGVYQLSDDEINVLACLPENYPVSTVAIASDLHILPRKLSEIIQKFRGLDFVTWAKEPDQNQGEAEAPLVGYEVKLSEIGKKAQVLTKLIKSGQVSSSPSFDSQKLAEKLKL